MEALYTIASVLFIGFLITEAVAGVILYRNRSRIAPAIRLALGLDRDARRVEDHDATATANFARLERKINYIGRHVNFEREQLVKLGILNPATTDGRHPTNSSNLRIR